MHSVQETDLKRTSTRQLPTILLWQETSTWDSLGHHVVGDRFETGLPRPLPTILRMLFMRVCVWRTSPYTPPPALVGVHEPVGS